MIEVSLFKNTFDSSDKVDINFRLILKGILEGQWKDKVEWLRTLTKEEYDKKKVSDLPGVTFSGTFDKRLEKDIIKHSGLIIIDIDKISPEQIYNLKASFMEDELIMCAFTSPSAKGIKVLVQIDCDQELHRAAFEQLKKHFEERYATFIDKSGKDPSRLCFVSYDPEMYFNEDAVKMVVNPAFAEINKPHYIAPEKYKNKGILIDGNKALDVCIKWVVDRNKIDYVDGQRNRHVHALACALNRCGVSYEDACHLINSKYSLGESEVNLACKSAYLHNAHEHASVELKDIDDTKPVDYIPDFSDDIVLNDIQKLAVVIYDKVDKDFFARIVRRYAKSFINEGLLDITKVNVREEINRAITENLNRKTEALSQNGLVTNDIENILEGLLTGDGTNRIKTYKKEIDAFFNGGIPTGNFMGFIGPPKTFKSVLAADIASENAKAGIPVLYLNGEMSNMQFMERLIQKELHIDLQNEMRFKKITPERIKNLMAQVKEIYNGCFNLFTGTDYSRKDILSTVDRIADKAGKPVGLIVIDGVTQMEKITKEEVTSTIANSEICKKVAKEANNKEGAAVIGLLHISTIKHKYHRGMSTYVRGGGKTEANMDGSFDFSLLVDPKTNELLNDDILYREGKFFLRAIDKREGLGQQDFIMEVSQLNTSVMNTQPSSWEVQLTKKKSY